MSQIKKTSDDLISLDSYLSKHSRAHYLDNAIKNWIYRRGELGDKKSVHEWAQLIEMFFNEKNN